MEPCLVYDLVRAYEEEGYQISVGLNPYKESPNGSFAYLKRSNSPPSKLLTPDVESLHAFFDYYNHHRECHDNRLLNALKLKMKYVISKYFIKTRKRYEDSALHTGGGISLEEIYFMDCLLSLFKPQTIYVIGVAFGWSTIAMGLISRNSKIIAIDNASEGKDASEGLRLTQKIAEKLKIDLTIYVGTSPQDVPKTICKSCSVDFAFIDGLHTNEQIVKDFNAILPFCSDSAVILFHDVLNWSMLDGWDTIMNIGKKNGFNGYILRRTTSGMGVLFRNIDPVTFRCIQGFFQDFENICPT